MLSKKEYLDTDTLYHKKAKTQPYFQYFIRKTPFARNQKEKGEIKNLLALIFKTEKAPRYKDFGAFFIELR
ncbi:MAG TPA: hypothetical protein DF364_02380 [Ruminococcaceae bacterium]|nr:hypothetical protein [Oscillospiraceae bacterium]